MTEKINALSPERNERGQFVVGHIGAGGRPAGSRNKLAEAFLGDVLAEWQASGVTAISDMREKNPGDFCKMIASLLPKDLNLNVNREDELTDDELLERIRALSETIAPFLGRTGAAAEGGEEARVQTVAPRVH